MQVYDYDQGDIYYPVQQREPAHWYPNMPNPAHPYQAAPRPESVIDLNFKRNLEQKIVALVAIGRMHNTLGKVFLLKRKYAFAIDALNAHDVRFMIEDNHLLTSKQTSH